MSTNDKTGEKLVDSMRRTKAAAADKAAATRGPGRGAGKRRTQSQARTIKPTPAEACREAPDPYQSGARVWPD